MYKVHNLCGLIFDQAAFFMGNAPKKRISGKKTSCVGPGLWYTENGYIPSGETCAAKLGNLSSERKRTGGVRHETGGTVPVCGGAETKGHI